MKLLTKIVFLLFMICSSISFAQTPGFNYQALILNDSKIEIPGTDIDQNKVPLGLEDVILRFTITNEDGIEYEEEHQVTTDENGLISVVVGEGTPLSSTFSDIIWDGKLKYLDVEINIIDNNEGFVYLDNQKLLYLPHPTSEKTSSVLMVNTLGELTPPYNNGDLIWVTEFGTNQNPTLMIWDGSNWVSVTDDFDPTNELGLIAVTDDLDRTAQFPTPALGDQVWNQTCECIEVYDDNAWVSLTTEAINGLHKEGNTIKLGGTLIEPTQINTSSTNTIALTGLQESTSNQDNLVVVEPSTGVVRKAAITNLVGQTQAVFIATNNQLQFSTPMAIIDSNKLDVYRNGVRIDFSVVNTTTIELEVEAKCFEGDKIRIVQLN